MLLKQAILAKVRAGEVSVAFRRWTKPSVKAGGFRVTSIGRLAIDEVRPVQEVDITEAAARLAGEASRADLMAALAKGEGGLHRIAFHLEGEDPRIALRENDQLSAADWAALKKRLARMDATAPWTKLFMDSDRRASRPTGRRSCAHGGAGEAGVQGSRAPAEGARPHDQPEDGLPPFLAGGSAAAT